jgi:nucleotidyltransferase AbiEii toxin of type IV toxin-antitoxin system
MSFHREILTEKQRKALRLLGPRTAESGFYLAGGTAIALHLGHRRSVDFDWFLEGPLADPLELAGELRDAGIPFETGQVARGTLYGTVHGVRISFIEFKYRMLDPLLPWEEFDCRLAGLRDLSCMKLSAIAQRGSRKDFVDLYALGRSGFSLSDMLSWYRQKFSVEDISHLLYALLYFDDADAERMPRMLCEVDWKEVKRTIGGWVRDLRE